jgi:hypothetical protein
MAALVESLCITVLICVDLVWENECSLGPFHQNSRFAKWAFLAAVYHDIALGKAEVTCEHLTSLAEVHDMFYLISLILYSI